MWRRSKQLELRFHRRGGANAKAGRKPKGQYAGEPHLRRPQFGRPHPVHVTVRMADHVWNLRSRRSFSIVGRALAKAAQRFHVQIVRFSVQGNHIHLIVEAKTPELLSRAMQGFLVRVARGLNGMMNRRGRVVSDRFHAHVLRHPVEARNAITYVRNNFRKHMAEIGQFLSASHVDEYSSETGALALPRPSTWMLRQAIGPPA